MEKDVKKDMGEIKICVERGGKHTDRSAVCEPGDFFPSRKCAVFNFLNTS